MPENNSSIVATDTAPILVVDDNRNNLLAMEASLERLGEEIVRAGSGHEALEQVQVREFAVILMDVQMPVMDGLETAVAIRNLQGANRTPIIFITAGDLTEDVVHRAYEQGAVDFIFKPYAPIIVRSKVQVFVDLFRNSQRLKHNIEELARAEEEVRQLNQALEIRVEERTKALSRALDNAETSEQRYRQLAEFLPNIVWTHGPDGYISYCNNTYYEYTGLEVTENVNEHWPRFVHSDDQDIIKQCLFSSPAPHESIDMEYRLWRACDQTWRYHLARVEAIIKPDGTVEKWLGIATEIEDKIQAEATLKAANQVLASARDRAVEASHAKSLFLANMSHELRTPLNAILGYAEMLHEELLETGNDLKEDANHIITAGRHLLSLIDDVLDMAKIEAGKIKLFPEPTELITLIEEVAWSIQGLARQRNNVLTVNVENLPAIVNVDSVKLRQILFNLLNNACKFTEDGSIQISSDTFHNNGLPWFRINIEDTGIGIHQEELKNLFKEFSQADPSPSRNYGGTGLGLALSQRFAHMMGGMITLVSEPGTGSTFTISLPVECPSETQD